MKGLAPSIHTIQGVGPEHKSKSKKYHKASPIPCTDVTVPPWENWLSECPITGFRIIYPRPTTEVGMASSLPVNLPFPDTCETIYVH